MNIPGEPREPSLENLLSLHRATALDGVRVALPGQITSYDATHQTATVQPLVQDAHVSEDGERVAVTMPPAYGVPVMFLGPARGRITWPVAAGDTCLLIYCSSSIEQWFARGGVVDPLDERRHDLSDPIAIVGLHDLGHVPTDPVPTNSVCIHLGGGVTLQVGGSSASNPVLLVTDANTLKTWLDAHTHGGVTTGVGTSGPPAVASPSLGGSSTLKTTG